MFRQLVASALFAGFAAGLFAAALQILFVVPLLMQSERYETGALSHFAAAPMDHHDHGAEAAQDGAGHHHGAEGQHRGDAATPLWRHGQTVLASVAVYCGFALLLVAGFALAERAGHRVTPRVGLVWGIAGFVSVQLLPAAGLAPQLPGSAAAGLEVRQLWWALTVAASAAGLAAIAFGRGWPVWALGLALLVVPHLAGAPQAGDFYGAAPPELAAAFAGRALATGAAVWAVLGLTTAYFWNRTAS